MIENPKPGDRVRTIRPLQPAPVVAAIDKKLLARRRPDLSGVLVDAVAGRHDPWVVRHFRNIGAIYALSELNPEGAP